MCVCNVKKLDKYILFVVSFSFFSFSCISFYFINIFLLALGPCKLYVNLFLFIYECHTNQEFKQFDMRSHCKGLTPTKKKYRSKDFFIHVSVMVTTLEMFPLCVMWKSHCTHSTAIVYLFAYFAWENIFFSLFCFAFRSFCI